MRTETREGDFSFPNWKFGGSRRSGGNIYIYIHIYGYVAGMSENGALTYANKQTNKHWSFGGLAMNTRNETY